MDRRPVIGISMGDPASIGPEVTIKAVADEAVLAVCKPVVVGDAIVLERAIEFTGVNLSVNRIDDIKQAQFADNTIDVDIIDMEFLGSFWRAGLKSEQLGDLRLIANFSINAIRRLDLEVGKKLSIELPPGQLKLFPAIEPVS